MINASNYSPLTHLFPSYLGKGEGFFFINGNIHKHMMQNILLLAEE